MPSANVIGRDRAGIRFAHHYASTAEAKAATERLFPGLTWVGSRTESGVSVDFIHERISFGRLITSSSRQVKQHFGAGTGVDHA